MTLPYPNVVDFQVRFLDQFATRRGFGTTLFLQSTEVVGEVDASNLTKTYTSIEEVGADFAVTDDAYKAANTVFSQKPRPINFKVAYYNATGIDAAGIITAINAIRASDEDWFFLTIESSLRDDAVVGTAAAIAAWAESRPVAAILDSNDVNTENPADTTNVAYTLANTGYNNTGVFYHTTAAEFPAVALCAVAGSFNFDDADSAYTPAFKTLRGITPSDLRSSEFQAATGFTPGVGQSAATGHLASVYVNVGGQGVCLFGSMATANKFLDEIHFEYWLKARGEEEMFNILKNTQKVPYDDPGLALLASGIETVLDRAVEAGHVARDIQGDDGEFEAPYRIEIPRALSVPASQRNTRVAPQIKGYFRHSGAVHFARALVDVTV